MALKPDPALPDTRTEPELQPPPATIAIEHLAKLVNSGVPPTRMVTAIEAILGSWREQGASQDELRERMEQLQTDLDDGVVAVEAEEGDAATDGRRRAVQAQRDALVAAQAAVTRVLEILVSFP